MDVVLRLCAGAQSVPNTLVLRGRESLCSGRARSMCDLEPRPRTPLERLRAAVCWWLDWDFMTWEQLTDWLLGRECAPGTSEAHPCSHKYEVPAATLVSVARLAHRREKVLAVLMIAERERTAARCWAAGFCRAQPCMQPVQQHTCFSSAPLFSSHFKCSMPGL
jgi:hypothetical protein